MPNTKAQIINEIQITKCQNQSLVLWTENNNLFFEFFNPYLFALGKSAFDRRIMYLIDILILSLTWHWDFEI
jgi:hypothetical protein